MTTNNNNQIYATCMLIKLHIRQWSGRKFDKAVTRTATDAYSADPEAGRFNKVLIDKTRVKSYQKEANSLRAWFYENSLPWKDGGQRIIKNSELERVKREYRALIDKLEDAENDFLMDYEQLKYKAATDLNGMFNPADYPTRNELATKFAHSLDLEPVPVITNDYRTTLTDEQLSEVKTQMEEANRAAIQEAMRDAWNRLYTAITKMHERLDDEDAIFRNSLIGNVCELVDILPRLNIADDPNLEKMRQEAEDRLCSWDIDNLRENPSYRASAAQEAKAVKDLMAGYMGTS